MLGACPVFAVLICTQKVNFINAEKKKFICAVLRAEVFISALIFCDFTRIVSSLHMDFGIIVLLSSSSSLSSQTWHTWSLTVWIYQISWHYRPTPCIIAQFPDTSTYFNHSNSDTISGNHGWWQKNEEFKRGLVSTAWNERSELICSLAFTHSKTEDVKKVTKTQNSAVLKVTLISMLFWWEWLLR